MYGCIRDSEAIACVAIGVKALGTHPRKSVKKGTGDRDIPVTFSGVTFTAVDHLYADRDGIVVASACSEARERLGGLCMLPRAHAPIENRLP